MNSFVITVHRAVVVMSRCLTVTLFLYQSSFASISGPSNPNSPITLRGTVFMCQDLPGDRVKMQILS